MLGKPSKRLTKQLEANGVRAPAEIVDIAEKGMAVTSGADNVVANTEIMLKTRLLVKPADGTPEFEVSDRIRYPQLSVPGKGDTLIVLYDPNDHDKFMVDRGSPEAQEMAVESALGPAGLAQVNQALEASMQASQAAMQGGMPNIGVPQPKSSVDQLEKLAKLHDSGALTDAEFEAQKAKVLEDS